MKKIAVLLIVCLLLLPFSALATELYSYETNIAKNTALSVLYSKDGDSFLRSYMLRGGPGSSVRPMVVFGDSLYGTLSVYDAVKYVENKGFTVMAAVNSDYFSMDSGVPTGMNVYEWELCSSGSDWNSIGFNADGSAFCGAPKLEMTIEIGEETYPLAGFNKMRTAAGMYLFSDKFADTCKTVYDGVELVLKPRTDKSLRINTDLELTVVSAAIAKDTEIPDGGFVLSATETSPYFELLSGVAVGDKIRVSATSPENRWVDAKFVSGGGNMLAQNGEIVEESVSETGAAPRTVIGVKKNGSYTVLVADGRQTNVSNGLTLRKAAQILLDDGCSDVINLDGGGSSEILVRRPGSPKLELISSPSDGSPRKCSVYILFVNSEKRIGTIYGSAIFPENDLVLAGAKVRTYTTYFDRHYYPVEIYSVSGGSIRDGAEFIAPDTAQTVSITSDRGFEHEEGTTVTVVETPDSISASIDGRKIYSLELSAGETVDINISATARDRQLLCNDEQFTFELSEGIGTIDKSGLFTAAKLRNAEGSLTVSCNGAELEIPIKIVPKINAADVKYTEYSFTDIPGHWAANYIEYLAEKGVFSKDEKFNPQGTLTNAMAVTLISRYLGANVEDYEDIELPYTDIDEIPSWALPHLKVAYAENLLSSAYGEELFEPNNPATRAQVMTVLGLCIKDSITYDHAPFTDYADIPEWAAAHIDRLYAREIVNGYSGTTDVKPLNNITRAEMAALMIRLY